MAMVYDVSQRSFSLLPFSFLFFSFLPLGSSSSSFSSLFQLFSHLFSLFLFPPPISFLSGPCSIPGWLTCWFG